MESIACHKMSRRAGGKICVSFVVGEELTHVAKLGEEKHDPCETHCQLCQGLIP